MYVELSNCRSNNITCKNLLNNVGSLTLLRRFLRVRLLEQQFDNITCIHVARINNQIAESYANYVLYWHLFHTQ